MKKLLLVLVALALGMPGRSQEVDPRKFVGPDNTFTDPRFEISFQLPSGWEVIEGRRLNSAKQENTFHLRPLWPSQATPALYYKRYTSDDPPPPATNFESYFHDLAQKKAATRVKSTRDYRNDPASFAFKIIDGHPSCSYLATFTIRRQKMAEYFVRVAGQNAHVMFFTQGTVKDIQAIRADIDKMAETVKVP